MTLVRRWALLIAALVALLGAAACADQPAPPPQATAVERAAPAGPGFQSPQALDSHYAKHGREFGDISKREYLALAQTLRDAPAGGDILEIVRDADHVITRFDKSRGYFGAYNPDRTIRTFFIPNAGVSYFYRQARSAH